MREGKLCSSEKPSIWTDVDWLTMDCEKVSRILVSLVPILVPAPMLDHSYPTPNGFGSGTLESLAISGAWTCRIWCYHFIGLYAGAAREK